MTSYSLQLPRNDNTLFWALTLSISLHILLAFVLPNIEIDKPIPDEPLTVEILQPKVTQPEPVAIPQPAPETPPPPPEIVKPKPAIKPDVKPALPPVPSPITEPATTIPPAETRPQPPSVMTAEPRADAKPEFTAPLPPPEPQRPVGPSQQDIDAARSQYGNLLSNQLAKYKNYPGIARTRGYEGDAVLEFKLDANGNLQSCTVIKSSGYPSLDNEALASVKKASPFPLPSDSLRGRSFTILVPVSFRLE